MKRILAFVLAIAVLLPAAVWGQVASSAAGASAANDALAGAWRAKVQFKTGMLADWKNLEFMYAFNHGSFFRLVQPTLTVVDGLRASGEGSDRPVLILLSARA